MRILVTGGAGFIGSCFVRNVLANDKTKDVKGDAGDTLAVSRLVNLDKLTYAGNLDNLQMVDGDARYGFYHGDIAEQTLVADILQKENIDAVVHFAAESHVDRSIIAPDDFITTNVVGTGRLLETCCDYWQTLSADQKKDFRFLHISTDEVFGSLAIDDKAFDETSLYRPNSPYAASKAGADHLVRSYHRTYQFPAMIANCSNNYGPYQFPEKFIPMMIIEGLKGKPMPIYGKGDNIRDWLFVTDHIRALMMILLNGQAGEYYGIGGMAEKNNLAVAKTIATLLDRWQPKKTSYAAQITFVADRPGHDFRYGMNIAKIKKQLGFAPKVDFLQGLEKTILWYLENQSWVKRITSGDYQDWLKKNYAMRS
ncbi:MAG: dTDP-glucose 4,6-dehydratase [Alphaproteobacteria bacterium]